MDWLSSELDVQCIYRVVLLDSWSTLFTALLLSIGVIVLTQFLQRNRNTTGNGLCCVWLKEGERKWLSPGKLEPQSPLYHGFDIFTSFVFSVIRFKMHLHQELQWMLIKWCIYGSSLCWSLGYFSRTCQWTGTTPGKSDNAWWMTIVVQRGSQLQFADMSMIHACGLVPLPIRSFN